MDGREAAVATAASPRTMIDWENMLRIWVEKDWKEEGGEFLSEELGGERSETSSDLLCFIPFLGTPETFESYIGQSRRVWIETRSPFVI